MAGLKSILFTLLPLICAAPAAAEFAASCLAGGPHTYTVATNDTIAIIADKFQVAHATIQAGRTAVTDPNEVLTDAQVKILQCSPSQCQLQPFSLNTTDLVSLAAQYNTTVGQIEAYNPGGPFGEALNTSMLPVIAMPMNCVNLSDTITTIS